MPTVRATLFEAKKALRLVATAPNVATVRSGDDTLAVDLRTGVATTTREATPSQGRETDLVVLAHANGRRALELGIAAEEVPIVSPIETAGVVVAVRDARLGPTRTVLSRGTRSTVLPGEPYDLVSADGELVGLLTSAGVFVANVGRPEAVVSFGYEEGETIALAAHDDIIVIASERALHVVWRDGGWARMPSPATPDEVAISDTHIVLLAGVELFAIDRATLPQGSGRPNDVSLAIAPRADARSDDTVCIVRTAFQKFVALTEVRTQRPFNITLPNVAAAQRFAKGDRVYVIDERLVKESELPPGYGAPEPTVLDASTLGPLPRLEMGPAPITPVDPAATELPQLARAIGFAPGPMFERFLSARRDDWCWPLGAFTPVLEKVDLGAGVDPCMAILFDEGSGDYFCTYDYPPARGEGHGFVHYSHDGDGLKWLGRTFEEALAVVLAEQIRFAPNAVLSLLRAMNLPVTFIEDTLRAPVPEWFEAAHPRGEDGAPAWTTPDESIAEGERRRREGDLLGAERCFVRALHGTYDEGVRSRASGELAELYRRLEWPFQAARL